MRPGVFALLLVFTPAAFGQSLPPFAPKNVPQTFFGTVVDDPYPAVMLTHGVNDPRVDVWHSTKMAARLLEANTSGKPILLNLDFDSGHGIGDTKAQRQKQIADNYAFLFWQMGQSDFQPAKN